MVGEKIRAGCRQVAYPVVGLVVSRKAVKPLYSATFFSLTTMPQEEKENDKDNF